ncbi:MAG TPA: hypothetical protein VIT67_12515 [Povalibacter sp.]
MQLAAAPPIGTLTRDWTDWYLYGSHNSVDVYWRARLYTTTASAFSGGARTAQAYCSIGGENNGNKVYYCCHGAAQVGRGGALGEASDVRPEANIDSG